MQNQSAKFGFSFLISMAMLGSAYAWSSECSISPANEFSFAGILQNCQAEIQEKYGNSADDTAPNLSGKKNGPFLVSSKEPHRVQMLENPEASLQARLNFIRQAKKSIQIETFYFEPDQAGNILLKALLEKKQQNKEIKIQILVDTWGSEGFTPELAAYLKQMGIETKFYNDSSPLLFTRYNQRNHRKLFLIDAESKDPQERIAIIGGVNMAAEHLGKHPKVQKIDREVIIRGPIVRKIQDSFQRFWQNTWTQSRPILSAQGKNSPNPWEKALAGVEVPEQINLSTKEYVVNQLTYVSDLPGSESNSRVITTELMQRLQKTQKSLVIENGYFIPTAELRSQFESLLSRGGQIEILTEGPGSTSSYDRKKMTLSYAHQRWLAARGGEVFGTNGQPGTHAKTIVQDGKSVFISSYNLDARSQNTNAELGVWLESEELAADISKSIRERKEKYSLRLDAKGKYGGQDLYEEFRKNNAGEERFTRWTRWLIEPFY